MDADSPGTGRRILFVSWMVPPERSGSAVVVDNLARQFGPGEAIVAGEQPVSGDLPFAPGEPPEILHVGVPVTWPRRGTRFFRWTRWLKWPLVSRRLQRLITERRVEAVIAVFPDEYYLAAAFHAARRKGVPCFPYFHNTYVENRRGLSLRFARFLQRRVFAGTKHVLVISEGMRELYATRYPALKRCSVLPHCVTEPVPEFVRPVTGGPRRRAVLMGTLNASCLDAAQRMIRALQDIEGLDISICTPSPRWLIERYGLVGPHVTLDCPSRDVLLERLAAADILLLPHGLTGGLSDEEYATIFPTRTIDLLISGKPILAHCPQESFLARFLVTNGCALVVSAADDGALTAAGRHLLEDEELRARLVRHALVAARQFTASDVAAKLKSILASEGAG